jgi:hypothetical protein
MDRLRTRDDTLLMDVIMGIALHGSPADLSDVARHEHALEILRELRTTIDEEIGGIEDHIKALAELSRLRTEREG